MRYNRVWCAARLIALLVGFVCSTTGLIGETAASTENDTELDKLKHEHAKALENANYEKKLQRLERKIAGADVAVVLDNKNGWQSSYRIQVKEGDVLRFRIVNTNPTCYSFNLEETKSTGPAPNAALATERPHTEQVVLSTIHLESTAGYEIKVTRRAAVSEKQCPYEKTWRIEIQTVGWELGFAGAYVVDRLTNPAFALRPGTGTNAGTNEIIVENDKEDSWNRRAAAMVHLFNSGSFDWGKGVSWAPLSFGIGIASNEDAAYYLGTGLKFGKQAFLTGGVSIGSRDELGPGLSVGSFISEPNLPLKSRTDTAVFIGISFSFLNANISQKLQQPFNTVAPKPEPDTGNREEPDKSKMLMGSATLPNDLNDLLSTLDLGDEYTITEVVHDERDGDKVKSLEFRCKHSKNNERLTEEENKAIVAALHNKFMGTTFKIVE